MQHSKHLLHLVHLIKSSKAQELRMTFVASELDTFIMSNRK